MTTQEEQVLLSAAIGSTIRKQLETVNTKLRHMGASEIAPKQIPLKWMSDELAQFVLEASEKFIKGQLEHGGDFLVNSKCLEELKQEQLDFFWYSAGAKYQKNKLQEALFNVEIKLAKKTPTQDLEERLNKLPQTKTLGSANIP